MSASFNISVSLEVFKKLTAMLEEGQSHDDVIRELLRLLSQNGQGVLASDDVEDMD